MLTLPCLLPWHFRINRLPNVEIKRQSAGKDRRFLIGRPRRFSSRGTIEPIR